ncbi:MAG: hypothetical protein IKJ59_07440 [Clostridia bacterium]|nr:hypothetical protein [Bacteroidales bacterium]MBR3918552.1 hypothetical protein [Clostridia bacterium]
MIYIENKRKKIENIRKKYPNADILDVTSVSENEWAKMLSPFYPHGNIPIPFSPGMYATCVEAIWQGLKVFKSADVDVNLFSNDTMKGLKRTVRHFGIPLGHRKGVYGNEILNYFDARMLIYLPSYKWVLDNISSVHNIVLRIAERSKTNDIVFLDYNTNSEFRDISSPISHAGLLKLYIEGCYPKEEDKYVAFTKEEAIAYRKALKETEKKCDKKYVKQLNLF